ncbi:hypothetical protein EUTSA_v10027020mg [Eutrema salsugineum]|uniref:Uncharacterized protein n=1 Tax=Eutrema salsugineum TaxID=72664 RepID=V4MH84_EUTSA|nr:hypothetical protein EUTSA_v10027020mg [Eutrema salsugineum]
MSTPTTSGSAAEPTKQARSSSAAARSSSNSGSLTSIQAMAELNLSLPKPYPWFSTDSCSDPKPAVKKECLHLLSYVCSIRFGSTAALSYGCLTFGALSGIYLKGKEEGSNTGAASSAVGLFSRTKWYSLVASPPKSSFQKLCPRICKLLSNSSFLAKASSGLRVTLSLFVNALDACCGKWTNSLIFELNASLENKGISQHVGSFSQ